MLHGQNLEVYERMGESLREELKVLQMQQRTWDDTHAAACRAEVAVLEQQLGKTAETDWQGRGRIAKHEKHGKTLALETGAMG